MRNSTNFIKTLLLVFSVTAFGTTNVQAEDLAVKFLRVESFEVASTVVVRWKTDSEFDNDFFTVQRSTDGGQIWKDLGTVPGSATTPGSGNYNFTDENPVTGNVSYRLRHTDIFGVYDYSWKTDIFVAPFTAPEDPVYYAVFPNPSDGDVIVEGDEDFPVETKVEMTDITGKAIPVYFDFDGPQIRVRTMQKRIGMYFLFVTAGDETVVNKIKFE